jgi:hypothetical protein
MSEPTSTQHVNAGQSACRGRGGDSVAQTIARRSDVPRRWFAKNVPFQYRKRHSVLWQASMLHCGRISHCGECNFLLRNGDVNMLILKEKKFALI